MARLLIVEADSLVASMLHECLIDAGHEVAGLANTRAQVQRFLDSDSKIDAALLDVSLRGNQSEKVATALSARNIPFLLLSDFATASYVSRRLIAKPFTAADLRQSVSQMLDERMISRSEPSVK